MIGRTDKPILSENPIIPVLAGQRPYVLDPWMIQLLRRHSPGFEEPLLERLREPIFSAVVLSSGDPAQKSGRKIGTKPYSFAPGLSSALTENYKLAPVIDQDRIYVPLTETSQAKLGTR